MIYYIIIIKDTNDANLSWHYKRIRWQSFNKQNCPPPPPRGREVVSFFFSLKRSSEVDNKSGILSWVWKPLGAPLESPGINFNLSQNKNLVNTQYTIHITQYTIHNTQFNFTLQQNKQKLSNTQKTQFKKDKSVWNWRGLKGGWKMF